MTDSSTLFYFLYGFATLFVASGQRLVCSELSPESRTIYDFKAWDINRSHEVNLSKYKGQQEPGANGTEILNGIKYIRPGGGFVPNFDMFDKIDVNGKNEHPLYTYIKNQCPPTSEEFEDDLEYSPIKVSDVRWNFEEFLIDKTGKPRLRFSPNVPPSFIKSDIEKLLKEKENPNSTI
ncbi:hypothetical protein KUTeg_003068 [Tegillarca granosa]|uniref:Glutathione peroxidase n=1 Tax=Tegillarca granosa TaxID=220873 RepID=A0ABQ9FL26_TEGGR|nr:hypothetical protein KUTeg_003068 [Tegillarca granosa]